ncbi:MAG: rhodanese-like domain-containing protein [Deltaproteobacteria bacterium]|nr:rhodanese-like domain-containing protein [Deltaproteobacteria bacterium]
MNMGFTKAKVLKGGWQEWDRANYETDPKAK